jgi:hypothetical protein
MNGKVVNMDKPMVLLKKRVTKVRTFMNELNDDDDEDEDRLKIDSEEQDTDAAAMSDPKTRTEYLVEVVIKRKLIFNKRPRPIVHIEPKKQ